MLPPGIGRTLVAVVTLRGSVRLALCAAALAIVVVAGGVTSASADLGPCTFADLQTAVAAGGYVRVCPSILPLGPLTTISFPSTITIPTGVSVTLDGAANPVELYGADATQLFSVQPGASLTLVKLTLGHGLSEGSPGNHGTAGTAGTPGANGKYGKWGVYGGTGGAGTAGAAGGNGTAGGTGTNGAAGLTGGLGQGGAVYVSSGATLTVVDDTFTHDIALGGQGGAGGAGGVGGKGGVGGPGGNGGSAGTPTGATGLDGGPGGNGGNGAQGGDGGNGGVGGPGGGGAGGAIYNAGTTVVFGSTFTDDHAVGGAGGLGGIGGHGGRGGWGGNGGSGGVATCAGAGACGTSGAGGVGGAGALPGTSGLSGGGGTAGDGMGGAIYNAGTLDLFSSHFKSDSALGGAGGRGGTGASMNFFLSNLGGDGGFGGAGHLPGDPPSAGGNGGAAAPGGPGGDGGTGGHGGLGIGGSVDSAGPLVLDDASFRHSTALGGAGGTGGNGGTGAMGGNGSYGGSGQPNGLGTAGANGGDAGNGGLGGHAGDSTAGALEASGVTHSSGPATVTFANNAVAIALSGKGGKKGNPGNGGFGGQNGDGSPTSGGASGSPGNDGATGQAGLQTAPNGDGTLIAVTPLSIPTGAKYPVAGQPFSQTYTVTGGTGPYTWKAYGLPHGISLTSTGASAGQLSGTATLAGAYYVLLVATDSSAHPIRGARVVKMLVRPSVTKISPSGGPTAGGTVVTITGNGFSPDDSVTFAGAWAAPFSYVSPHELTATAPAWLAEPVHVVVSVEGVASPQTKADTFTYG